jgi:glycosyltransferase involved in cell wall biosynthesis
LRFLFLEAFYGGSHRVFADGLAAHSGHAIDLVGMPARFWKWRMRGAALHFNRTARAADTYDGLIVTNLIGLADLKALWGSTCPPTLLYMHENQFTYPLAPGESRDYHLAFTDITSALTADRVLFNSRTHRKEFLAGVVRLIRMMPDRRPNWVLKAVREKSAVLYPGCHAPGEKLDLSAKDPLLIIWNHRWEFDKDPETFFEAIESIDRQGIDFRLAVLGERFREIPEVFNRARERFGRSIVHFGYEKESEPYYRWLAKGAIVVSTAIQENFGMAVVEAVRRGCLPLLPNRLVYPELVPPHFHSAVLYDTRNELEEKLARYLNSPRSGDGLRAKLAAAMSRFDWQQMIPAYEEELTALAGRRALASCHRRRGGPEPESA